MNDTALMEARRGHLLSWLEQLDPHSEYSVDHFVSLGSDSLKIRYHPFLTTLVFGRVQRNLADELGLSHSIHRDRTDLGFRGEHIAMWFADEIYGLDPGATHLDAIAAIRSCVEIQESNRLEAEFEREERRRQPLEMLVNALPYGEISRRDHSVILDEIPKLWKRLHAGRPIPFELAPIQSAARIEHLLVLRLKGGRNFWLDLWSGSAGSTRCDYRISALGSK